MSAESEIPLAWPVDVAVSDTVNRRVVKVRLGAHAEEVCDVK